MSNKKDIDLDFVKDLALSGFTHRQIAKTLNISPTTLYKRTDIMDTIKAAESELRIKVANDIKKSCESGEVAAQIFLSKRLNLFSVSYKLPQVKTIKAALTQINKINSDLAAGLIPYELAAALIKNLEIYIKGYELSELENRLTKLEEALNEEIKN